MRMEYGEHALSHTTTYTRFWCFKDGQESLDDDEKSGRPVVQNLAAHIRAVRSLTKNPHLILCAIAKYVNLSKNTVSLIVHKDLKWKKVMCALCAVFFNTRGHIWTTFSRHNSCYQ